MPGNIQADPDVPASGKALGHRSTLAVPLLRAHVLPFVDYPEHLGTIAALQILDKLTWHYDEPFADSSAVHAKAEEALARAKAAIPQYFGRLPKNDCFVEDIPEYQAPYTTIAYYQPGVAGGDEPVGDAVLDREGQERAEDGAQHRRRLIGAQVRDVLLRQIGQDAHDVEVAEDLLLDAVVLHLDDDFFAGGQPGAVHLGDGGGRQGGGVHGRKHVGGRDGRGGGRGG